jgi:hypothetical protein
MRTGLKKISKEHYKFLLNIHTEVVLEAAFRLYAAGLARKMVADNQ